MSLSFSTLGAMSDLRTSAADNLAVDAVTDADSPASARETLGEERKMPDVHNRTDAAAVMT